MMARGLISKMSKGRRSGVDQHGGTRPTGKRNIFFSVATGEGHICECTPPLEPEGMMKGTTTVSLSMTVRNPVRSSPVTSFSLRRAAPTLPRLADIFRNVRVEILPALRGFI